MSSFSSNDTKLLHHGTILLLSIIFSYEHSEIFPAVFYYALLVFLDEWNEKKSRTSRGKSRAMETHFHILDFFFFSEVLFPTSFWNDSLLFVDEWMQEKFSKFEGSAQSQELRERGSGNGANLGQGKTQKQNKCKKWVKV